MHDVATRRDESLAGQSILALRPVVVRFTDPTIEDAHVDLIYERVKDENERRWPDLAEDTVSQFQDKVRAVLQTTYQPCSAVQSAYYDARKEDSSYLFWARLAPGRASRIVARCPLDTRCHKRKWG